MKIIFIDYVDLLLKEELEKRNNICDTAYYKTKKEIESIISNYDGIIISGKTHHLICGILNKFQPKSLSIASMGKKPKLITYELPKCYSLFDFDNEWVTGYGIGPDEHRTKKFLFDSKNL